MKGRIKDDDSSVPQPDGPYEYGEKYRAGDQHGIYFRKIKGNDSVSEEILLDADALAKQAKLDGYPFFDISAVNHSDDHKHLAYAADLNGSEKYQIIILNLNTGQIICPPIENTSGDFEWAKDNQTLFWVERDDKNRPCKVWRRDLLKTDARAKLVYTEKDPGFFCFCVAHRHW